MASVDVPVALLGYGTVGAAVDRLLTEGADEIERATGHRLTVVRALVRDRAKARGFEPDEGVFTEDFADVRDNMRKLLSDIREGTFASEWIGEMQTGEPHLKELRAEAADQKIETVGKELRGLMHKAGER